MAINTRQTSMLVAEDWTRIYQTFRNADFKSYDYETIRKSMVDYLRLYYAEDFNDFIESSEYVALLDLMSFLAQSIAFRSDLNAREGFIDTAQRRDSILKLARLISYNPKRNIPATGYLKIDSVSTTENVYDSDGYNLSGYVVNWNDAGNTNWLEQFTTILNASFYSTQVVGKPANTQLINDITNDEYQISLIPNIIPTFSFTELVGGSKVGFEIVSPTSYNQAYIYEKAPLPNTYINILNKTDNLGNSSNNTGFFLYFKQGKLETLDINFSDTLPNRIYSVNVDNINNTDIWLYKTDAYGNPIAEWTQVPAVGVTNVIYNKGVNKNIYQVNTRASDQIDLIFGDGSFANIPQGTFRLYYRVSNGSTYKITPDEMQNVIIPINYVSKQNRIETINIRASLQYTVANSAARETLDDIKQKAPQQYYTQDRMVTGEDYNILPYTLFNNVLKVKAVNRTSSGVSRFLDVIDSTGKYSSTNIFAQDGILYKEQFTDTVMFDYLTKNDIYRALYNKVVPLLSAKEAMQFFYAQYPKIKILNIYWKQSTVIANGSTGYFTDLSNPVRIGSVTTNNMLYVNPGAVLKFSAGTGKYFNALNQIRTGTAVGQNDKQYLYATVVKDIGNGVATGTGTLSNGTGAVTLNIPVPTDAVLEEVFTVFNNAISLAIIESAVALIQGYADFGLRYDINTAQWKIVTSENLSASSEFSLANTGDVSRTNQDASWFIKFKASGESYTVYYRGVNYIFESVKETNFYFDGKNLIKF